MRNFLLKLHYYLAFIFLIPLVIGGLTGLVIAFDHALDEQLNPRLLLHKAPPLDDRFAIDFDRAIASVQPILQEGDHIKSVMVPRTENANILVSLDGAHGAAEAYVDPRTYILTGIRARDGHLIRTVYKLHATLLLSPIGNYLLLLSALSLTLLSIGGIINWLWHPSRKLKLRVKYKIWLRWWDIHRFLGIIAAILLLIIALSGGTLVYNQSLGKVLNKHQKLQLSSIEQISGMTITAAQAIEVAKKVFAEAKVTHLLPPAKADKPWQIGLRQPGEPRTSKGMSKVIVHPYTGAVLGIEDALAYTGWQKWELWAFPLHNGEWAGLPMRILHAAMGFVLLVLAYTGTHSFLARRRFKMKTKTYRIGNLQKSDFLM